MRIFKRNLKIERIRRSGPGGQHRNRKATGVRVTHIPTGITVLASERRSQSMNLEAALERLKVRVKKLYQKPKLRKKTKPTQASKEKRLQTKKRRSLTKSLRRSVRLEE